MSYRILVSRTARKHFDGLPPNVRARVTREVEGLRDDPRPPGTIKLKGIKDEYRIRIGDYRVRYHINDAASVIEVIDVRHRRDVYRP